MIDKKIIFYFKTLFCCFIHTHTQRYSIFLW